MLSYAGLMGPVNLLFFCRKGRRNRIFWTTPLIALVATGSLGILILIQDGAKYHTSKATQAFFHTHRARLTRCQLPSYSPDFNPIEHLWKTVRQEATHNIYFPHFEDVIASVEDTLQFLVRHRQRVRNSLGDYAAEKDIMPKAA